MKKLMNIFLVTVMMLPIWLAFPIESKAIIKDTLHGDVVDAAITILPSFLSQDEVALLEGRMRAGAIEEDHPFYERSPHHAWNPNTNEGWEPCIAVGPCIPALQRANYYFYEALDRYAKVSKGEAYYLLGQAAHLLQDVATPAHAHGDPHPPGDKDLYEKYLDDKNINEFRPANGWGEPVNYHGVLLEYDLLRDFDNLPNNFKEHFINHAHNYAQGKSAQEIWEDGPAGIDPDLFHIFYYTAEVADDFDSNDANGESDQGSRNLNDNEKLREIGNVLIPVAVRATAELIELFWEKTHVPKIIKPTRDSPAYAGSPDNP